MAWCQYYKTFFMIINKLTFKSKGYPEPLRNMKGAPKQLYHTGAPLDELLKRPRVTIVGSRNISVYGERVTRELASQLAEQGVVIISGLAFGVDAVAHRAALEVDGLCIAVLPSPLDNIVPVSNVSLAQEILQRGGALVSEYAPSEFPQKQNFIARNRIMSGLGQIVVITEAAEKSGSLHTSRFAGEQGITVMTVPGEIYKPGSVGTNNLIKSGAGVITSVDDVLHELGLIRHETVAKKVIGRNKNEQILLDLMLRGLSEGEDLLNQSSLEVSEFNIALTMLEIGGKIRPLGANNWAIS